MTGQLTRPALDEYVEGHLHQRLAEDPRVSEQGIGVTVAEGEIYLTGVVGTAERRDAISVVAAEYAAEHQVHNGVTVGTFPEPTAEEALT
ncbi:MAG: BON domain-containing protein [Mycobacteriales bacterium]